MNCKLCNNTIDNYNSEFHLLKIDDSKSVNICPTCIDKFLKWQQKKFAKLFPTKSIKKKYGVD